MEIVKNISTISGVSEDYIIGISDDNPIQQSETKLLKTFNKVRLLPKGQQDKVREAIENMLIDLEKKS